MASTRQPAVIRFAGRGGLTQTVELSQREVMYAEMLHCLVDTAGIPFNLPPDRKEAVREAVSRSTSLVAEAAHWVGGLVVEEASGPFRNRDAGPEQTLPHRAILDSKVVSATAHHREIRNSGLDYWHHTSGTAAGGRVARKLLDYNLTSPTYTISQSMDYLHDTFEALRAKKNVHGVKDHVGAFVGSNLPLTPMVAWHILAYNQVSGAYSGARSLLNLTRSEDAFGLKRPYFEHHQLSVNQLGLTGLINTLVKNEDQANNYIVDPDILNGDPVHDARVLKNWAKYDQAMKYTRSVAERLFGPAYARLIEAQGNITADQVRNELELSYPMDLDRIAEQVKHRIAQRLK